MEEEETQFDTTASLTDDDLAAALGFATTLGEQMLPQDEMGMEGEEMQEEEQPVGREEQGDQKDVEQDERLRNIEMQLEEGVPNREDAADTEIAAIRKELEQLQQEVYGQETEDTEPTG